MFPLLFDVSLLVVEACSFAGVFAGLRLLLTNVVFLHVDAFVVLCLIDACLLHAGVLVAVGCF